MSTNTKEKTTLILCDISPDTNKTDIESFLSEYKEKISSVQLNEKKPYKAMVSFKDYNSANDCRINMNQKKIKITKIIYILKAFQKLKLQEKYMNIF